MRDKPRSVAGYVVWGSVGGAALVFVLWSTGTLGDLRLLSVIAIPGLVALWVAVWVGLAYRSVGDDTLGRAGLHVAMMLSPVIGWMLGGLFTEPTDDAPPLEVARLAASLLLMAPALAVLRHEVRQVRQEPRPSDGVGRPDDPWPGSRFLRRAQLLFFAAWALGVLSLGVASAT